MTPRSARPRLRHFSPLFIMAVSSLLISTGCAHLTDHRGVRLPSADGRLLVEKLVADRTRVTTLRSFARLMLLSEGRAYRASIAMLLERPDRFRIEFLGPFRHPRHIVAFDGKMFSEIGENNEIRLQDAQASGSTLSFLGLTPGWLVSAVLGLPPISPDSVTVDGALRETRNRIRLELSDGHAAITLWTTGRSGREQVEKAIFDPKADEEPLVEMLYSDFIDVPGEGNVILQVPRIITISIPERSESLRILLSKPDLNADLDAALFRIGP